MKIEIKGEITTGFIWILLTSKQVFFKGTINAIRWNITFQTFTKNVIHIDDIMKYNEEKFFYQYFINTTENCVCVSALKAVRDKGENRRCYGNLKKGNVLAMQ